MANKLTNCERSQPQRRQRRLRRRLQLQLQLHSTAAFSSTFPNGSGERQAARLHYSLPPKVEMELETDDALSVD